MKIPLEQIDMYNIFAKNIDCVYTLEPPRRGGSNEFEAVLTSTHNLCFESKIRQMYTPVYPNFTL